MYTNDRFCIPCYNKGIFTDGDNFCSKCKDYLCLACVTGHGFKCGNDSKDFKSQQHEPWKKSTNAKTYYNKRYTKDEKLSNMNTSSNDTSNETTTVEHSNENKKSPNVLIRLENNRKTHDWNKGKFTRNTQTEQIVTEKKIKQTFSARCGLVSIRDSLSQNVEKLHRCYDHPDMAIENLCTSHDALCCDNCLSVKHTKCIIQPIDEVAYNVFESEMVDKLENEFSIAKVRINEIKQKCELYFQSKQRTKEQPGKKKRGKTEHERENLAKLKTKCNELDENISISLAEIKSAQETKSEIFTFITLKLNEKLLLHLNVKIAELLQTCHMFIPEKELAILKSKQQHVLQNKENKARQSSLNENKPYYNCDPYENANSTVIGDVVLHLFEADKTNGVDKQPFNDNVEIITNESMGHDDNKTECQENESSKIQNKANTSSFQESRAKYVDFVTNAVTMNAQRSFSKHRVQTYGLTTEYYMSNDDEDLGEIRVLRLQSAPPERSSVLGTDSNHRSNSAGRLKDQTLLGQDNFQKRTPTDIIPWNVSESSRITQAGDNGSKGNDDILINGIMLDEHVKQKRFKQLNKKPKSAFRETLPKCVNKKKSYKETKSMKSKLVSQPFQANKKSILSKTKPDESTIDSIVKTYGSRDERFRLKQWIKQTEEMNKMYINQNRTSSTSSSEYIDLEIDNDITARNKDGNNSQDKQLSSSSVPLIAKEATVIKVLDPDNRQSSAKSRTSESEEAHYINQSYAHPPKSQLVLSKELIVRIPEDDNVCEINSIACLPDGRILVSDFSNMQLKLLSIDNSEMWNLKLDEPPHNVTVVSNSIAAAITGLAHDVVLILNVGQVLTIKRRFKTDCVCKAMGSYKSHIYLLCLYKYKTEIHILTIDGVLSIRFNLGSAVTSPKSIAINALNGLMYVVDQNRGMYTIERCGKITSRCFDRNIEQYVDVETDLNNGVFLSTKNPCGIYELDYDGRHLLPILLGYKSELVKAVSYNTANNSLVLGCANSEAIQIYKIHNSLSWKRK